jgi:hypothetical protein
MRKAILAVIIYPLTGRNPNRIETLSRYIGSGQIDPEGL